MPSSHALVTLIVALLSILSINAQSFPCTEGFSIMKMKMKRNITNCKKLETLGAEFGWNYNNDTRNMTVDIFFGLKTLATTGWVAWGVNPLPRPQMIGTRALIAILRSDGHPLVKFYNITGYTKIGCRLQPSQIELGVNNPEAWNKGGFFSMSATLNFPQEYNLSNLNLVWQVGSLVVDSEPLMHATTLQNVDSTETIDLTTGKSRTAARGPRRRRLRIVHGILNTIGWGTLLPIGVIIVRYIREFPVKLKWWFKVHVTCQILGFTLGTIGWGIGIWLGNASKDYTFRTHRIIGIIIFTFATLQMLALWLKPIKRDEFRKYWNIYHHFLGYALIVVIIVNIFKGIHILGLDGSWKWAYVGLLGLLGFITLVMESFTWIKFVNQNANK